LSSPLGLAVAPDGTVFIADTGNNKVRRLATDGTVTTTINAKGAPGTDGDGGFATQAQLTYPVGLALDASGNLFVADNQTSRIRRARSLTKAWS
jgi:sugar lactone lactonase YvrE